MSTRLRAPSIHAVCLLVVFLCGIADGSAQVAEVRVSASPYYVGVPIDVQVIVEGFERSPEPTIDVEPPKEATLKLAGVSPNVNSSIQIINGQMTRSERIRFVYRYRLIADRAGPLELGPFRVAQGATRAEARGVRFAIENVPTASEQRFRLVLPDGPLWVGQRVTVKLEWWLSESFAKRLAGRRARVPLFDLVDRFTFEDKAVPNAKSTLTVDTAAGVVELPASVGNAQWRSEPYLVVSALRTMIALKPGTVSIDPASIVTEEATRWSNDFFGNRTPAAVRRLRVEDKARMLTFKSPPAAGRPASFSGAVGTGFSIEVSADRSVVQTGDPIRLAIDVRGDAALAAVSLPELAVSGLHAQDFKVPSGPVAGIVEDGTKRFDVVVRVNNEQVREIPPIELSWFNPNAGRYETTQSRPIAMSVRAATVVSAADVVTSQGPESGDEADAGTRDEQRLNAMRAPRDRAKPAFTLTGAELSIETRAEMLLNSPVPWYAQTPTLGAMYLGGLLALGLATVARRRAVLDPTARAQRRTLEAERNHVAKATSADDIARALRRMAATSPPATRDAYDALLVECDNVAYAPSAGDDAPVDTQLRSRALVIADAIVEAAR